MTLKYQSFFAAMFAFAVAAGAGSARAALISGHLDPEFGGTSPLSGLYFTGDETFTVANACLGLSGFVAASGTCDGSTPAAMNFTGATIKFWNDDPATDPLAHLLGTATFPSDASSFLNPILGMYVSDGKVVAVQSLVIGTAAVTLNGSPYLLDIQFGRTDLTYSGSNIGEYNGDTFTKLADLTPYNETTLFIDTGGHRNPCNVSGLASNCAASDPALTTLKTYPAGSVPEPATWATMLLGVGAIGAAMRWRRTPLAVT